MRETIRNFHIDGKIYVRENPQLQLDIGPVIIIFDHDYSRYPVLMTWKKEFPADIERVFYAEEIGEQMAGPGISICHYGGCLSYDYIPSSNAFSDFALEDDYTYPEILLAAAILSSKEKYIVYVDNKPPEARMRTLAGENNKVIIYLPIYMIDPAMLKKIRKLHVLNDPSVRVYAEEYIRLEY
jgi:hypothetical protein